MAIILFGGEKGGTGKTTIATNMASMRAIHGKDILLAQADPQKSSMYWSEVRNNTDDIKSKITSVQMYGDLRKDLKSLEEKFDDIIIDCGGYDSKELRSALVVADIVVCPIRPSQFDIWTISPFNDLISEVLLLNKKLTPCILANQVSSHFALKRSEFEDMSEFMTDFPILNLLDTKVVMRQAYRTAAIQGKGVIELSPSDDNAVSEMKQLYSEIFL